PSVLNQPSHLTIPLALSGNGVIALDFARDSLILLTSVTTVFTTALSFAIGPLCTEGAVIVAGGK
ncbi:hypothetical protein LTS01_009561, partial [Friedmanniomyces endolithicus]